MLHRFISMQVIAWQEFSYIISGRSWQMEECFRLGPWDSYWRGVACKCIWIHFLLYRLPIQASSAWGSLNNRMLFSVKWLWGCLIVRLGEWHWAYIEVINFLWKKNVLIKKHCLLVNDTLFGIKGCHWGWLLLCTTKKKDYRTPDGHNILNMVI